MPSIIMMVFVLQLVIHLVNTLVSDKIKTLLWSAYSYLPISTSKQAADHRLQQEFISLRTELKETSSQDEFAKWARLRRHHDKVFEQLEKTKASLDKTKAMFDFAIKTLYSICTVGLRIFLLILYAKQPIFWLPQGLVPYYAEWLLSFPYAPLGSIGILAWQLACVSVISLVNDALVAISALVLESGRNPEQRKNEETTKRSNEKTTT